MNCLKKTNELTTALDKIKNFESEELLGRIEGVTDGIKALDKKIPEDVTEQINEFVAKVDGLKSKIPLKPIADLNIRLNAHKTNSN